jgi:membrane-bound lytic murein transglycosylase D
MESKMSLAQFITFYLNLNILIGIGFLGLGLATYLLKAFKKNIKSRSELRLHYNIFILILGLAFVQIFLPKNEIFSPAVRVWTADSIKNFAKDYAHESNSGYLSIPSPVGLSTISADHVTFVWTLLAALVLLFGFLFIGKDLKILFAIKRNSFLIRRIGKTQIFINESIQVPFSYCWLSRANVVVPSSLLSRHEDFKMAVSHEIQHHRAGDTLWVYILWSLKLFCIINPAIFLWNRWISEIQEFACDEALVDQKRVNSQAYARCLVEVAKTAVDQKHVPVCATGLTFLVERQLLKRRIEKMLAKKMNTTGWKTGLAIGFALASIMAVTTYASKGLVQDRRISMAQAKAMAERAKSESGFPIVLNEFVLKELNRFVGTPEGREFMRDALLRMENHKELISEYLQKYNVPSEILAVPIVESGYQNLSEKYNSVTNAAGMWQFIRSTARVFGLKVDTQVDERLNIPLATDAAIRYLQINNLRFKDWQLSLMSYNMGENAVQKAMNTLGTRDPWVLIRAGYENDKAYLPKVIAAILIMKNPESIK